VPVRFFMDHHALSGTYDIFDGEEAAGTLTVSREGGYDRFLASCRVGGWAVLHLMAETEEGREVPLGVLVPGSGGWLLDRRLSPRELRRLGLGSLRRCTLRREEDPWTPEPDPGRHFSDSTLRALCRGIRGALLRREGEALLLALPLAGPFPLLPIFCLGTPRRIRGDTCLVFQMMEGKPRIVSGSTGQTTPGDPIQQGKRE